MKGNNIKELKAGDCRNCKYYLKKINPKDRKRTIPYCQKLNDFMEWKSTKQVKCIFRE